MNMSSEHRSVDELLPWYVNDTLDNQERARVEQHVATCAGCQENVRLWSKVRRAVQDHSPVPLVPEADTDALLNFVEDSERSRSGGNKRALYPLAAAALLVVAVAVTFLAIGRFTPEAPSLFETVISDPADNTVQYIVELQFDENATTDQRKDALDALGSAALDRALEADSVTLHLGAASLPELQERINGVRALPHVVDARIIAVHLPVD